MRVLSPASDSPTPLTNKADCTESAATTTTRTVPTVALDADVVSHNMAARLCATFLAHVLFLKNQVPFPIVQLAKMPTSDNSTRAAKKRQELLTSFDALASHLYTTFVALSTALALRGVPDGEAVGGETLRRRGVARAFVVVALGPTVGTAKARVVVGIDGLETRVWGVREDEDEDEETSDADDDEDDGEEEEESTGGSDQEEAHDASGSDDDAASPPSRSPSPSTSSSGSSSSNPRSSPASHTEDPETVRAAERLLSRTLASACAEDDGRGLASEMAPTQTHVLLRAPRRFDHPAWVPRQNLGASLDGLLAGFFAESAESEGKPVSRDAGKTQKRGKGGVQGIWITSRERAAPSEDGEDLAEDDEWVWWSWDGKLVGFADW